LIEANIVSEAISPAHLESRELLVEDSEHWTVNDGRVVSLQIRLLLFVQLLADQEQSIQGASVLAVWRNYYGVVIIQKLIENFEVDLEGDVREERGLRRCKRHKVINRLVW
jgi:hypothetical protein